MSTAKRIGRLGVLAVGLGIGAAMAAVPGTASATTDFDISIDGIDILNGGGSASAVSGRETWLSHSARMPRRSLKAAMATSPVP